MKSYVRHIIALILSIFIFCLTSCALFIPNDSFKGGQLLDDEKVSQIKAEIFATEALTVITTLTDTNDFVEETIIEPESSTDNTTTVAETSIIIETQICETEEFSDSPDINETFESEKEESTEVYIETEIPSNETEDSTAEQIESESFLQESCTENEVSTNGKVYWTKSGKVWHLFEDCGYLKNSSSVLSGSIEDAISEGKEKVCSNCSKKQEN